MNLDAESGIMPALIISFKTILFDDRDQPDNQSDQ
jgi:hypothetical protein